MITAISEKYTTARKVAQKAIDLVFKKFGYKPPKCKTEKKPVYGGNIYLFKEFLYSESKKKADIFETEITNHLIYSYGSRFSDLLYYANESADYFTKIHKNEPIIKAQVIHGIRQEMAQKLTDVVFRRIGLGNIGDPGDESLNICATLMANELGWSSHRSIKELDEVRDVFEPA